MSLRLQRGNLSNSCMDIPKISRNTSGAKWRCEWEKEQWSVPMATWMALTLDFESVRDSFGKQGRMMAEEFISEAGWQAWGQLAPYLVGPGEAPTSADRAGGVTIITITIITIRYPVMGHTKVIC